MTEQELQAIRHALGLTKRGKTHRRWAYRNYYAAADSAEPMWRGLETKGFARCVAPPNDLHPYYRFIVTPDGVTAAGLAAYVPKSLTAAWAKAPAP